MEYCVLGIEKNVRLVHGFEQNQERLFELSLKKRVSIPNTPYSIVPL